MNISIFLLALTQIPGGLVQPIRLKAGDTVAVYVAGDSSGAAYSGDYSVMSDGSIYGLGFGKLAVEGKTWDEAQDLLRSKMKRLFRSENVFLAIKKERTNFAYVVGANSPGPVALPPNPVTVRQILPPLTDKQDGQRLVVEVVRAGKSIARVEYTKLLQGDDQIGNQIVRPNDLISIVPEASIRIWVLGAVKAPGQLALPAGTNIYEAVASAGGFSRLDIDSTLSLRHGPFVKDFPYKPNLAEQVSELSDGDVITAVAPETVRVTIAGEVLKPGDYPLLENTTILGAIASASGVLPAANLSDILVYRNGELLQYDLSGHTENSLKLKETIQGGDTIFVREKKHMFFVFGEVKAPGRFMMDDNKSYHASDVLAMAGGLTTLGTLRYVYLMHPVPNGKPVVTMFNLDEYLKDGIISSNPEVRPGDSLLFGQPRGISFTAITQVLSSYLVLNSLAKA